METPIGDDEARFAPLEDQRVVKLRWILRRWTGSRVSALHQLFIRCFRGRLSAIRWLSADEGRWQQKSFSSYKLLMAQK